MARRGGSRNSRDTSADTSDTARLLDSLLDAPPGPLPDLSTARLLDEFTPSIPYDGRRFDFDTTGVVNAGRVSEAGYGRMVLAQDMSTEVATQDPRRAAICVRRRERREVLFAKRRIRRGSGGSKRFNWRSGIRC